MVGAALIMARFGCNARKRKQGDRDRQEPIGTRDARVPRGDITAVLFVWHSTRLRMWTVTAERFYGVGSVCQTKTIASERNQLDALHRCDAGFHDRLFSDDPDNSLHGEDHPAPRERPEGWHGTTVARSGRRRHMARSIHASVISGRIL